MLQSRPGTRTMLYLGLPILILAIYLIRRGFRGRTIDDHPLCAACGFDLFGKPPESQRCSECGILLGDNNKRIRIGHRERRRWSIALGLFLLLASATFVEIGVRDFSNDGPIEHHLPFRVLLYETHWKNSAHQLTAFQELVNRYDSHQLDPPQIARLVDDRMQPGAPAIYPPTTLPYEDDFDDDLLERARANGDIPDSNWEPYVRRLSSHYLKIRQKVRRGDPVPIKVFANVAMWNYSWVFTAQSIDIDGIAFDPSGIKVDDYYGEGSHFTDGIAFTDLDLPAAMLNNLADGVHTMHLTIKLDIKTPNPFSLKFCESAPFTLLPADTPSVRLLTPTDSADTMKTIFSGANVHRNDQDIAVDLPDSKPPVVFIGDVFIRTDNQEWRVGAITAPYNWELDFWLVRASLPNFHADHADLIFRPNPAYAARTLSCFEIWGKEIIIPDVPVR